MWLACSLSVTPINKYLKTVLSCLTKFPGFLFKTERCICCLRNVTFFCLGSQLGVRLMRDSLQDTSKPVRMMKQVDYFNFALLEDAEARILEIPYKGKDLSMIVLLPNEVEGLQKVKLGTCNSSCHANSS